MNGECPIWGLDTISEPIAAYAKRLGVLGVRAELSQGEEGTKKSDRVNRDLIVAYLFKAVLLRTALQDASRLRRRSDLPQQLVDG